MNYLVENYRKWWVVSLVLLVTLATSIFLSVNVMPSLNDILLTIENSALLSEDMLETIKIIYDMFSNPIFLIVLGVIVLFIKLLFNSAVVTFTIKKDQADKEVLFPNFSSVFQTMIPALYADAGGYFLVSLIYIFKLPEALTSFIGIMVSIGFLLLIFYFFKINERGYKTTKITLITLFAINLFMKIV